MSIFNWEDSPIEFQFSELDWSLFWRCLALLSCIHILLKGSENIRLFTVNRHHTWFALLLAEFPCRLIYICSVFWDLTWLCQVGVSLSNQIVLWQPYILDRTRDYHGETLVSWYLQNFWHNLSDWIWMSFFSY